MTRATERRFEMTSRFERASTLDRRTSTWPSSTMSASWTRISSTMPPSKCWTTLRLFSSEICPIATTALSILATAAQPPKTPKVRKMMTRPMMMIGRVLGLAVAMVRFPVQSV